MNNFENHFHPYIPLNRKGHFEIKPEGLKLQNRGMQLVKFSWRSQDRKIKPDKVKKYKKLTISTLQPTQRELGKTLLNQ